MAGIQLSGDTRVFRPNVLIRHYRTEDRDHVFRLLSFLPNLYPRSFDWLERRLADVERKNAHCTIALVDYRLTGILIDTPKGVRTSKISTLFVKERASHNGIGSLLFESNAKRWQSGGVDDVYVTVPSLRRNLIEAFLRSNGFAVSAILPERYGPDRHELIYSLKLN